MDSITSLLGSLRISRGNRGYKTGDKDRRKFGFYHCKDCNRKWQSANSWEEFGQECQRCGKLVMAYKRQNLIKPEENKIDLKKEHPRGLCEKCKKYGDCTSMDNYY
ncbi:hypothetical protein SteCoe_9452 [Stentor coeruleus]|uniref:3CxxC-type domain-containing protein n=1 Tax=Stentor coeruleus TaxID=5963 RepID=A0A1R2CHW1_9CILI|nr:hypothetical protein SteCoe_9452 [Stentor coeruleus]